MILISRYIRYFLLGIFFVAVFIPVLDGITQIILTALEWVKGMMMIPITKINCKLGKLTNEGDEPLSNPIGFCASFSEEEDDTDEDL